MSENRVKDSKLLLYVYFFIFRPSKMENLLKEIADLKNLLKEKDEVISDLRQKLRAYESADKVSACSGLNLPPLDKATALNNTDIARFSRQIILPEFRVKSQKILKVGTDSKI